jgi:hypothetical protein
MYLPSRQCCWCRHWRTPLAGAVTIHQVSTAISALSSQLRTCCPDNLPYVRTSMVGQDEEHQATRPKHYVCELVASPHKLCSYFTPAPGVVYLYACARWGTQGAQGDTVTAPQEDTMDAVAWCSQVWFHCWSWWDTQQSTLGALQYRHRQSTPCPQLPYTAGRSVEVPSRVRPCRAHLTSRHIGAPPVGGSEMNAQSNHPIRQVWLRMQAHTFQAARLPSYATSPLRYDGRGSAVCA